MNLTKALVGAAIAPMIVAPAFAAPTVIRASATAHESDELGRGAGLLALLAVAAIVAGLILLASNDDGRPASP